MHRLLCVGSDLCNHWRIADDVALSAARHIRALRLLGAGLGLAPPATGAGSVEGGAKERRRGRARSGSKGQACGSAIRVGLRGGRGEGPQV